MYERIAPISRDQDAELEAIMERAALALERLGITVEDIVDELPAARGDVLHEIYGSSSMREIDRRIAALKEQTPAPQPGDHG